MRFSQRFGYKPIRDAIQIESMDEPLRNGIWNVLTVSVWDQVSRSSRGIFGIYTLNSHGNEALQSLCQRLWLYYFKKPLDKLSNEWNEVFIELRTYFFNCSWNEVYDFIEFVADNYEEHGDDIARKLGKDSFKDKFSHACNQVFEQEMSGYRFIDGQIAPITHPRELASIEEAIHENPGAVDQHFRRALELLSDRKKPDYRNSIKESISAVEALVAKTVKAERGTLGQLLKKLETYNVHPAMIMAFNKLYGYTSDEQGVRHALMDASTVDPHDAKFMLVTCTAFVNFVKGKSA